MDREAWQATVPGAAKSHQIVSSLNMGPWESSFTSQSPSFPIFHWVNNNNTILGLSCGLNVMTNIRFLEQVLWERPLIIMKEEPRARISCHPVSHLSPLFPQALTFSLLSSSALPNPFLSKLPQMSLFDFFSLLRALCLYLGDIFLSFHRDCYENRSENNSRASGQAAPKSQRIIWPGGTQRESPGRGGVVRGEAELRDPCGQLHSWVKGQASLSKRNSTGRISFS